MRLVPIDFVTDIDPIESSIQADVLHEPGMLPTSSHTNRGSHWPGFLQCDGIRFVESCEVIFEICVDVPGVVVFGRVLKCLQLIAAASGGDRFELRALVIKTGDAARLWIYCYPNERILHRQTVRPEIGRHRLATRRDMEDFVPERRHSFHLGD